MNIRKARVVRSARRFLAEIGTITIGILIALGLEEAVDDARDRKLVEHARADLRRELIDNRAALAKTVATEKASAKALDAMLVYGASRLAGTQAPLSQDVTASISFAPMETAAWESTQATQALVHMPYAEAQALSQAYAGARAFNTLEADAVRHWYELTASPEDPSQLSDMELKALLRQVRLNRSYGQSVITAGEQLLRLYDKALGELD